LNKIHKMLKKGKFTCVFPNYSFFKVNNVKFLATSLHLNRFRYVDAKRCLNVSMIQSISYIHITHMVCNSTNSINTTEYTNDFCISDIPSKGLGTIFQILLKIKLTSMHIKMSTEIRSLRTY